MANDGQTVIKNYEVVDDAALKLHNQAVKMAQLFSEIKTEINKIGTDGDGTWRGDAADEVKAKFVKWSNNFSSFVETLESCSKHVQEVSARFKEADAKLNQSITTA